MQRSQSLPSLENFTGATYKTTKPQNHKTQNYKTLIAMLRREAMGWSSEFTNFDGRDFFETRVS